MENIYKNFNAIFNATPQTFSNIPKYAKIKNADFSVL